MVRLGLRVSRENALHPDRLIGRLRRRFGPDHELHLARRQQSPRANVHASLLHVRLLVDAGKKQQKNMCTVARDLCTCKRILTVSILAEIASPSWVILYANSAVPTCPRGFVDLNSSCHLPIFKSFLGPPLIVTEKPSVVNCIVWNGFTLEIIFFTNLRGLG